MAYREGLGSPYNGRGSDTQRLGVERFGGQITNASKILMCQSGTHYHPGLNMGISKDGTLFALKRDAVEFDRHRDRCTVPVKETI